ncbi:hypothetical protein OKA05_05345 [Luteolibacter arcticus]|uniref:SMP-30/Gluconolactonase/LRE-like region domain-containing protein n=1 Tax=Luteolibacter arcticus TaxID=1581411 RepID=A0ABT3GES2_9BACT|nr:hypothetical protein [Luteolibacter arcticus]MCW1921966.1 hypothetical protein [Luteolibacter arcticus]
MRMLPWIAVVACTGISPLSAGSAAFLPDGRILYAEDAVLQIVTPGSEAPATLLTYPEGFAPTNASVARAGEEIIVAGEEGAMAWKPGAPTEQAWRKVWTPPEGESLEDVAVDPKSGMAVFVTSTEEGTASWWAMASREGKPGKVYNRRANGAENPVFDAAGNLYFTLHGDVWKGGVEVGDSEEVPFVLTGTRIWPLAELETGPGNSSGTGANGILPLKDHLVVERSRLGGSGWGQIVRVPNADAFEAGSPLKWDELEESSSRCHVALSPDGGRALIYIRDAARWFEVDPAKGEITPLPKSVPPKGE